MTDEEKFQLNEIYQHNVMAVFAVINKYKQTDKEGKELLDWKRQECVALLDAINAIKRDLDWRAGEKIEPVAHSGEAVLQMVGGIG